MSRLHLSLSEDLLALQACPEQIDASLAKLIVAGFNLSETAIALFRPDDTIALMSTKFREIFAVSDKANSFADIMVACKNLSTGLRITADFETWIAMAQSKRRKVPYRSFETDTLDGRWFLISETTFAGGWLWVVLTDITVLKSNERMLRLARDLAQQTADTDELTGLRSRRYAMAEMVTAVAHADATSRALSVAIIDIDFFKRINDRWGHDVGDKVLRHFAEVCQYLDGAENVLARIGGEEFLLIMPGQTASKGVEIVERLRKRLATACPAHTDVQYTFSAGVACYKTGDSDRLLKAADDALYRAKHRGRNRTCLASSIDRCQQTVGSCQASPTK